MNYISIHHLTARGSNLEALPLSKPYQCYLYWLPRPINRVAIPVQRSQNRHHTLFGPLWVH
jgi:hypothetical protein